MNDAIAITGGDVVIKAESAAIALPQIKKADLPQGKSEGATNIQYLSDLYSTNKKVDELNKKVVVDGEYSSNLYLWINGSRTRLLDSLRPRLG